MKDGAYFVETPGAAAHGYACPECGRIMPHSAWERFNGKRGPDHHAVVGVYLDRAGNLISMRIYCLSCEHIWDEWDQDLYAERMTE